MRSSTRLEVSIAILAAAVAGTLAFAMPAAGSASPHCERPDREARPFTRSPGAIVYRKTVSEPGEERFELYWGCVRSIGRTKLFWDESEELAVAKRMELRGVLVTFVTSDCVRARYTTHRVKLRSGKREIVRRERRSCP